MCLRNNNYCKKKIQEKTQSQLRKRLEIVHLIKKIIWNKIMSFQLKQFVLIKKKLFSRVNAVLLRKLLKKKKVK